MGKILLYSAGRACQSFLSNTGAVNNELTVHPYKDINGAQYTGLYWADNNNVYFVNASIYNGVTGYISADTEQDFSLDLSDAKSYETRDFQNISYSRSSSNQTGGKIYTIQATNNGSEAITVCSLKFRKNIKRKTNSGATDTDCVLWGYFLDAPVTIGVGETKTFAINIDS